jgi:predicted nucleic acid-binding protein
MLLVYLLDDNAEFGARVRSLLARSFRREDQLFTSYLALAEALVGMPDGSERSNSAVATLREIGFKFLPFDEKGVGTFRRLRSEFALKGPDAMHLACAAANGMEMFLTGDKILLKKNLHVPGIHFVVNFETATF